jgi:archaellum component FlaC
MSEYPTITGDFREFRGETNVMVRMMGDDLQKLDRELSKTKRELSEVKLDLQHLKGKIAVLAAVIGSGGGLAASLVGKLF